MSFGKRAVAPSNRRKKSLEPRAAAAYGGRVVSNILSVFLAAIVWFAFDQSLGHQFVDYDDHDYVDQSPKITNGLTLSGIRWAFTHVHANNWHPLTTISHMLDCQLFGVEPWGHHLTNILLHAAAAILLFLALRELTGSLWPSVFVASVFAVHPMRVESVAWVSERKDLLSGVFFMLTLWAYARYAHSNRSSFVHYITVVVLFAFGLMCKPTMVTLPFVLLLLDYWPLGRTQPSSSRAFRITAGQWQQRRSTWRWLVVEKIPLFMLSAASCVATLLAQKEALDASLKPPLGERVGNALISYAVYLGQMIWPARLAVLYPYPEGNLKIPQVILALLLLLVISTAFFLWRRTYPFLLVGWVWYLGMLVPMIGIVQVGLQVRADRYTYLPQIGLYILVAWGAMEFFYQGRRSREILAVAALVVVAALTTRSYFQTSYWQDTETLWKHAIASTSNNYVVHNNLSAFLLQSGRFEEAIAECQKALKIKPDLAPAHNNLGVALLQNRPGGMGAHAQNGVLDEAIEHYRKALEIKPDFTQARINLGDALLHKGQMDEAIAQFQKVLQVDPDDAEARYGLGNAFVAKGKYSESIANYEAAVRIRPDYLGAYYNLGRVLATIGKTDQALKVFNEALRVNGNSAEVHCTLGSLLGHMGHREEAVAHLLEALRLKPDYENAKQQLRELGVSIPQ